MPIFATPGAYLIKKVIGETHGQEKEDEPLPKLRRLNAFESVDQTLDGDKVFVAKDGDGFVDDPALDPLAVKSSGNEGNP